LALARRYLFALPPFSRVGKTLAPTCVRRGIFLVALSFLFRFSFFSIFIFVAFLDHIHPR